MTGGAAYWQAGVLTHDKYERMDKHDKKMLRWLFENPRSHRCMAGLAKFMGVAIAPAYNRLAHLALSGAVELDYPSKGGPAMIASGYIRIKVSARFWEQLVGIFGQEVTA